MIEDFKSGVGKIVSYMSDLAWTKNELERKKKSDAESKIRSLEERMKALKS